MPRRCTAARPRLPSMNAHFSATCFHRLRYSIALADDGMRDPLKRAAQSLGSALPYDANFEDALRPSYGNLHLYGRRNNHRDTGFDEGVQRIPRREQRRFARAARSDTRAHWPERGRQDDILQLAHEIPRAHERQDSL